MYIVRRSNQIIIIIIIIIYNPYPSTYSIPHTHHHTTTSTP